MAFEPIARSSLAESVVDQLADEILAGRIAPGDALPSERSLSELLGVNRGAVREAIQRLAAQGLVRPQQGSGNHVLDYRQEAGLDLLPRLLVRGGGQVDPAAVRSVAELRACIGADAARLAAARATPAQRRALVELGERLAAAPDRAARQALALELWQAVVDAADNIAYRLALNSLVRAYAPVQALLRDLLADELDDVEGHRAVVRAIEQGHSQPARDAAAALLARGSDALSSLALLLGTLPEEAR